MYAMSTMDLRLEYFSKYPHVPLHPIQPSCSRTAQYANRQNQPRRRLPFLFQVESSTGEASIQLRQGIHQPAQPWWSRRVQGPWRRARSWWMCSKRRCRARQAVPPRPIQHGGRSCARTWHERPRPRLASCSSSFFFNFRFY
jgi:hypothetical protein